MLDYAALARAVLAHPCLLAGFHASGRMAALGDFRAALGWVGVAAFLTAVFAVPAFAFLIAIRNDGAPGTAASPEEVAARRAAHLVFAAPPLFTATGVVLAIFDVPGIDILLWTLVWVGIFGLLGFLHRCGARTPNCAGAAAALRVAHGVGAALIILFFLAMHLANHVAGLWSPDTHKSIMNTLRDWYRAPWLEPLLVLTAVFMVSTGRPLVRYRTVSFTDAFGTLHTMTGAYLAAFLASHLTATFMLARWKGGVDTNWDFAVGNPAGLFADPWNVRLIPHYLIAVAAATAHAACGLRIVLLAHEADGARAGSLARTIIAAGVLLAAAIMAGMLGLHLGR